MKEIKFGGNRIGKTFKMNGILDDDDCIKYCDCCEYPSSDLVEYSMHGKWNDELNKLSDEKVALCDLCAGSGVNNIVSVYKTSNNSITKAICLIRNSVKNEIKQIRIEKIKHIRKEIADECRDSIDKDIEKFIKTNCKQISPWHLRCHVEALRDKILDNIRVYE